MNDFKKGSTYHAPNKTAKLTIEIYISCERRHDMFYLYDLFRFKVR